MTRWIRLGLVTLNGQKTRSSARVKSGDQIMLEPPPTKISKMKPQEIPLNIVYEDQDLLVINKAAEMVVHPGAGHSEGTLTNGLLAHCGRLSTIGGIERPGLVHRLDKGTSGVMVVAKNDRTHVHLSHQFKNHEVTKVYWAVVYGTLKRKEGTYSSLITRNPDHRKKFAVSQEKGKKAVTHYKVLKEAKGLSLIELHLETGRTHQIRVHLTHAGHGVVGDPIYGGHDRRVKEVQDTLVRARLSKLDHTLLHARRLGLIHPSSRVRVEWSAPLPDDFREFMKVSFE